MEAALGILDDDDEGLKRSSGVALPDWMWTRLDDIAKKRGKSRNWVIGKMLTAGISAWEREQEESAAKAAKAADEKPNKKK